MCVPGPRVGSATNSANSASLRCDVISIASPSCASGRCRVREIIEPLRFPPLFQAPAQSLATTIPLQNAEEILHVAVATRPARRPKPSLTVPSPAGFVLEKGLMRAQCFGLPLHPQAQPAFARTTSAYFSHDHAPGSQRCVSAMSLCGTPL